MTPDDYADLLKPLSKVPDWHGLQLDSVAVIVDGEMHHVEGKQLMYVLQKLALALWQHHSGFNARLESTSALFESDRALLQEAGEILSGRIENGAGGHED